MTFIDRTSAGRLLGELLRRMSRQNPLVFALPRGGVPIGYEIAKILNVPLEVLVVRKIGAPKYPEYGIGAVAEDGTYWVDAEAAKEVGASSDDIERIARDEFAEVGRRVARYRAGRALPNVQGRTTIIVDDGLATGVTARAACHYLKAQGAGKVILAVPVGSAEAVKTLRKSGIVDEVICIHEAEPFFAVGDFYDDFTQVTDEEVITLLTERQALAS